MLKQFAEYTTRTTEWRNSKRTPDKPSTPAIFPRFRVNYDKTNHICVNCVNIADRHITEHSLRSDCY